jgi:hypothetical protein
MDSIDLTQKKHKLIDLSSYDGLPTIISLFFGISEDDEIKLKQYCDSKN